MKNVARILGFFCILVFSNVQADSLTLEKASAAPGDTASIDLVLNNSVTVGGFQFVVNPSPDGLVGFVSVIAAGRAEGWTVSTTLSGGGTLVLAYSATGARIEPGNGAVLTFRYRVLPEAPGGTVNLVISELVVSDPDLNPVTGISVVNGSITAKSKPTASFTREPAGGSPPLTVEFDASASSDTDGTITGYQWIFGDGGTGSGVKVSHVYSAEGTYNVTLSVTDNDSLTGTASRNVIVYKSGVYKRGDVNRDGKRTFSIF